MSKKVYIVRHTQPEVTEGTCYGVSDLLPSTTFESEAATIKNLLPNVPLKVFSSPLQRCSLLAQYLSEDGKIDYVNSLKEMDFGDWEMKEWRKLPESETAPFYKDFVNITPPGGESFCNLHKRVVDFWKTDVDNCSNDLLLITHAGVIRSMLSYLLEMPLKRTFSITIGYSSLLLCTQIEEKLYNINFLKT